MTTTNISSEDIAAVLAAASSPTHPAGPPARVAVAALAAAVDVLHNLAAATAVPRKRLHNEMSDIANKGNNESSNVRMIVERPNDSMEDDTSCLEFLMDEKVWKPLIYPGYIESQDLGKLLLCTSRRLTEAIVSNDPVQQSTPIWKHPILWKLLCDEHWGKKNADNLLRKCHLGPEACFRNFVLSAEPATHTDIIPMPLKFQPKDYLIVVEVRRVDTFDLICHECIPGNKMSEFFRNGHDIVPLSSGNPIILQSFSFSQIQQMYPHKSVHCEWGDNTPIDDDDWEFDFFRRISFAYFVKAHIMRLTDQKVLNLLYEYGIEQDIVWRDFVHKDLTQHTLRVRVDMPPPADHSEPSAATHSRMSALLNSALDNWIIQTDILPDFQFVIENPKEWRSADTQCRLVIAGLRFRTSKVDLPEENYADFEHTSNVQYAHFLEASEAWRDIGK